MDINDYLENPIEEDSSEEINTSEKEVLLEEVVANQSEMLKTIKGLNKTIENLNENIDKLQKEPVEESANIYSIESSSSENYKGKLLAVEKLRDIQVSIYEKDISFSGNNIPYARDIYYAQQLGLKLRHITAELKGGQLVFDGDKFRSSSGYLKFNRINLGISSMLKGFIRKNNSESFFLPSITGNGTLQLKDTVKYLYMIKCVESRKFILEQGVFSASAGQFSFGVHGDTKLGSIAFSGKNILQTTVEGVGILILELPVHPKELVILRVTPDRPVRVNEQEVIYREGNVLRNKKLASGLFGSMASGTGFVEEYTGDGLVILAPSLNLTEIIQSDYEKEINESVENYQENSGFFGVIKNQYNKTRSKRETEHFSD